MNNHMFSKLRDEITYPFANVNGCAVEVWECVIRPILCNGCNYLSMLGLKLIHIFNRGASSVMLFVSTC